MAHGLSCSVACGSSFYYKDTDANEETPKTAARALRAESLFPIPLRLFCLQAPLAFKVRHSGGLSPCCRTPRLGSPIWGSDPLLFGENLCDCVYPPTCGSPSQGCESWIYCVSAPPTHLIVVPSLYLQLWKMFSASLQVIPIDSCSVNSCNFDVPMKGGEFRGLLLHYLGHTSPLSYFLIQVSTAVQK